MKGGPSVCSSEAPLLQTLSLDDECPHADISCHIPATRFVSPNKWCCNPQWWCFPVERNSIFCYVECWKTFFLKSVVRIQVFKTDCYLILPFFYYIACPIPLLKSKTKTKTQLLVSLLWWLPKNPSTGIQSRYSMVPAEKADLSKCLDVNPVVYMQLLPFLLGHCSSHLSGLWDSIKQWIFSLCKNNMGRKYWHIKRDKEGRKYIKNIKRN